MSSVRTPPRPESAIWQDVEFGAYDADLALWEELAAAAEGRVLELGAGAGRVALQLARKGIDTVAAESDAELARELERRRGDLPIEVICGEVTSLGAISAVRLALAPLHLIQMLSPGDRPHALGAVGAALAPPARVALVIVDESTFVTEGVASEQGPPDMREIDGWVYSSEPLWVQVSDAALRVRRLRERVSPGGELERTVHDEVLHRITPEQLELEAAEAGMRPLERRPIPSGGSEADSLAVILEAR